MPLEPVFWICMVAALVLQDLRVQLSVLLVVPSQFLRIPPSDLFEP